MILQARSLSEDNEQIVVRLATETTLMPLYLAKITNDNSPLDNGYFEKLEEILQYDLNHNGMTFTISQSPEKEKLANRLLVGSNDSAQNSNQIWKSLNAHYIIKLSASKQNKLTATLLSANEEISRGIEGLSLSGNYQQDRRQMHQLADAIHKVLFGKDGIASTHILYTIKSTPTSSQDKKWISEVWEADYDGGNARQITQDSGYNLTPIYVPPKAGFASGSFFYVSYKGTQPKIYVASLKDGKGRRLTTLRGNQLMPTLSWQRDKVAFICDITGHPDLFVQAFNPDVGAIGKPQQIFAWKQAAQGSPTFSPDGKQIAFVSNKDGTPRIYVMDIPAPGTSLKDVKALLVTKNNKESSAPAWSPDGTKLAYCSMTNGARQIWVYDLTTKQERQLTQGGGNKENPTWAPNSLHLMYNSSDAGACELFMINLNQTNATKITAGPGEKRFPNWEPKAL